MLSVNKLAISVGASTQSATVLPGPIAGVCDSKWHHVAITYGDGSPTAYKQYTDGVLLASNPSVALSVLPAAAAVRVGYNGGSLSVAFTTVGTASWTVPPGVTSVNVLVVAGGGGGGSTIDRSAGGGGAGGMICTTLAVTPGQVIPITVGAGGLGGVVNGTSAPPLINGVSTGLASYPGGNGEVRISLKALENGRAELIVEDDGIGRRADRPAQGTGVGTRLVTAMAGTLRAEIAYLARDPGTAARLVFPLTAG